MFIGGLQKTTLSDFPNKVAAIVFLVNCNFKCVYCYNKEMTAYKYFKKSKWKLIPEEEFFDFVEKSKKMLDGIAITGGEPTCSPGLIDFITKIRNHGLEIKLDTNGSNPKMLAEIIDNKLVEYIAMDIKAPLKKYKEIARTSIPQKNIRESIELIKNSGIDHEFRTTIYPKLTKNDFIEMASYIPGEVWFLQQFVPKDAFEGNVKRMKPLKKEKINEILKEIQKTTKAKMRNQL